MHVIDFINEKGLDALTTELGIIVNEYSDRVVLNYSQTDSPKYDPVVQECRGLILSYFASEGMTGKTVQGVLARSFDRFYNLGEVPSGDRIEQERIIQHSDAVVTEKVDGSLCSVHYDGEWQVATRKMAYAEGKTARGNTFKQVFERALGCSISERFDGHLDPTCTYVFELVSPETRIVHPYPEDDVFLLAVRRTYSGKELTWDQVKQEAKVSGFVGFKTPRRWRFRTVEEIVESAKELPTMDEGYVCRLDTEDGTKRIKIKNPKYVAVAHMRINGAVSTKRMVLLIMASGHGEYLKYFPEDRKLFEPYIIAYNRMYKMVQDLMPYMSIENQKDFAMNVKDTPVCSIMFMLRKGMKIKDALEHITDDGKVRMLEALKDN